MNLSDFDFDLPEALIATRPARPRTAARLLLAQGDAIRDLHVRDLPDIFRPGDRLVLNNTRVLPARLFGQRQRGAAVAKVEITLLDLGPQGWRALAKPLRKVQPGEVIRFSDVLSATVAASVKLAGITSPGARECAAVAASLTAAFKVAAAASASPAATDSANAGERVAVAAM